MRTRNVDGAVPSPDEAASKGGRSLRKRTRIDYSFDQADEEEHAVDTKATPNLTRSIKKRRVDSISADHEFEEDLEPVPKRRLSELPPRPVVRRSVGRKSLVEPESFTMDQLDDDVAVQDTIEVGGHHSHRTSEGSSQRRSSHSSQKEPALLKQPHAGRSSPAAVLSDHPTIATVEATEEPETTIKSEMVKETQMPKIEIEEADPAATRDLELVEPGSAVAERRELEEADNLSSVSSPPPADAPSSPVPDVEEEPLDPYARLTPYIKGATVLYPMPQANAKAPSVEPDGATEEIPADDAADDITEMPDDSTPAASPAAIDDTAANSPAPEIGTPDVPALLPKKQYPYKKMRPAQEFVDFIADYETLSYPELWARLDHLTNVLGAIQNEHTQCRKIIDDEENAVKYQQEEAMFQHRVKLARSKDSNADPVRKEFVVKGIRAPKSDPMIEYARQQDRVMANAYGFEYDERDSKVSQQDPIGQRGGIGKGRLRDRPKQTAKAAEADDGPVIQGKRPRKAPNLFGDFEPASRGSTPVPTLPKKRRGRQALDDNDGSSAPIAVGETPLEESPKKRGRGGRPRKHPLPVAIPEDTPAHGVEMDLDPEHEDRPIRKRRKRNVEDEDFTIGNTNGQTSAALGSRRRNSRLAEVPSGSFYSTTSTQPNEESRPNTSSSTGTVSTTASAYGLREKRQRRFSLDDEDDDFEDEQQRKPKRIRRAPKKIQEQDFAGLPASLIPGAEPPAAVVHKVPRIKLKGVAPNGSASASFAVTSGEQADSVWSGSTTPGRTQNNGATHTDVEDNKDYGQMTKSEKMSASMKGT